MSGSSGWSGTLSGSVGSGNGGTGGIGVVLIINTSWLCRCPSLNRPPQSPRIAHADVGARCVRARRGPRLRPRRQVRRCRSALLTWCSGAGWVLLVA
jgi:hypothetical protein